MTPWSPRFETGHPRIDAEHREFFRQLSALHDAIEAGAGREKIVELISILQRYALGHFAHEERHMQRVGCPAHNENCAAHRAFADKLDGWLGLLGTSNSSVSLLQDIHRESTAWIESHIARIDCRLRGCHAAKVEVSA
jgi:hemerythrin